MNIKEELFKQCEHFVNKRLQTIQETISSNQKALQSETKSSAGDKHETGRAMLQLEMEKTGQQLKGISLMNETLTKINPTHNNNIASLGSIVSTTQANYFLSISAGKLTALGKEYFAISPSTPIGKLLLGKKEKDEFFFNGNKLLIIEVV